MYVINYVVIIGLGKNGRVCYKYIGICFSYGMNVIDFYVIVNFYLNVFVIFVNLLFNGFYFV